MICEKLKFCAVSSAFLKKVLKTTIKRKIHFVLLALLAILASSFQGDVISFKETDAEKHADIFKSQVTEMFRSHDHVLIGDVSVDKTLGLIGRFYENTGFKPKWTINYSLNKNANDYIEMLSRAYYFGLDSNKYGIESIRKLQNDLQNEKNYLKLTKVRVETEVLLTHSSARFINALQKGILFERTACYTPDSLSNPQLISNLNNILNSGSFTSEMLKIQPQTLPYKRLQGALQKFLQSIEMNNSFAGLPDPKKKPEKAKLTAKNILLSLSYAKNIDDERDFTISLKKFQKLHGLEQSGELDRKTCKALNVSSRERYNKIALNLERLKQDGWNDRIYLLVNIPAFNLKIVEDNKEVATYKTVIGKPISPTPVFSGKIEKIVTNPCWIVPKSISSREILYRAKKDSAYLARNKYLVFDQENNPVDPATVDWTSLNSSNFDYRIIQQSNPYNALGKIKFLFPNKYSVYVHDTPSKKLFSSDYRALSHGCVRLENPHYLAEYIIKKQQVPNWEKQLHRNLSKGIQEIFRLSVPVNIHLRYYTCEADDEGKIYFFDDIYNKDKELMDKLHS